MQKNKVEVSERGKKTLYIPLSVYRSGKRGLTISFPGDTQDGFKFGTSDAQLKQFISKLEELFKKHVEKE